MMHVSWRSRVVSVAIVISAMTSAVTFAQDDTITLERRARRRPKLIGVIKKVSRSAIAIETKSGELTKVAVNDVQRITLGDEPVGLRQARAAVNDGQFEQAVEALASIRLPESARRLLKQEVGFYRVLANAELALRGTGDMSEAEAAMKAFLNKERTTFHFYHAVELLGHLATANGHYEEAARYYSLLRKAPWPENQMKSHVLLANALRAQEKWAQAIEEFDEALQLSASDASTIRQQTMAQIGKAACLAELGKATDSIDMLQAILAKHDETDGELFAKTYLALGAAYQKLNLPMDAILSYLHVDLLFYKQRDAHAESLFYLAELWPAVEQPARGVESRKLLLQRYAGTVWAKRTNE